MIYLKKNISQESEVIAICDSDLIGKKLFDKGLVLDITERFYKGELLNEEEIIEILKNAKNINIVGKEAVKLALKIGIIEEENILKIQNIPHALVFGI
ncbi:MAG: DUF424 family protein [Nanoarchaeota archaeon]